ncbi:MAG: glycosyltransferase family 4 protein [Candidatus Improbicoccus devescovinae]|nr:MAG: glycosyltransferase family 4 protein [Candidatus Improbicoccus devescovinae]
MTLNLVNKLCKYHKLYLITICEFYNFDFYDLNKKIKFKSFCLNSTRVRGTILKSLYKLYKFIKSHKIEILISSGSLPVPIIFLLRFFVNLKFLNCKIIFWEHECVQNRGFKSILFRRLANIASDKIVVISERTLYDYTKIIKTPAKKLCHIYNFLSSEYESTLQKYNSESKLIMSVGRLEPEKGFDFAIEIAKIVFDEHLDWTWDIYGAGSQENILNQKIKNYKLENNIFLKGRCENIHKKYKKYAIFVSTSRREGFSLVILEAKFNSIPIVSFDCPCGPNEILKNNINGCLISCYNIQKMAEKISFLIKNPQKRLEYSKKCCEGLEKFNSQFIIKKWLSLFENL